MDFQKFLMYCAFDQSLPQFLGEVNFDWNAENPQHRLLIKKAAQSSVHYSVSHCPMAGGFVGLTIEHPALLQVGLDVEEIDRVTEAASARIANPRDHGFSESTPAILWSAREAAFKSLRGDCQPQIVSQIFLTEWKRRDHEINQFTFSAMGASSGTGYAWGDGELQFALALWTPDSQFEKGCRSS